MPQSRIKEGDFVEVIGIHSIDFFYSVRNKIIGRIFKVSFRDASITGTGETIADYFTGSLKPIFKFKGESDSRFFIAVKVRKISIQKLHEKWCEKTGVRIL